MAIKVIEPIFLEKYGLYLSNLILSLKGTYRVYYTIHNGERVYVVDSTLYYYNDRDKNPIFLEQISYTISELQLSTNLIEYLYLMIKTRYVNYQDI